MSKDNVAQPPSQSTPKTSNNGTPTSTVTSTVSSKTIAFPDSPTSALWNALQNLNQRYVFVRQIASIATIPTPERPRPDLYTPATFIHSLYPHLRVDNRVVAREWVRWKDRREVYALDYRPGCSQFHLGNLNTWLPSPIKPVKGDLTRWNLYLDHLFRSDSTYREWFMHWLAYPMQNPGFKLHTAVVFWSTATATGKSTLGYIIGRLYGRTNFAEITEAHLHGSFNWWAAGKQFIMGEEIKGSNSQKQADFLKSLITQKTVVINTKMTPQYELPDCINYYFTSNHEEAFYLEASDRRFFVHELGPERFDPYYAKNEFQPWLENGGYEAILYHLLNEIDLSKPILGGNSISADLAPFNPFSAAPQSGARQQMIDVGRSEAEIWLDRLADEPCAALGGRQWSLATGSELFDVYCEVKPRSKVPEKAFMNLVKKKLPLAYKGNQIRFPSGDRVRLYILDPSLDTSEWGAEQFASCHSSERES